MHVVTPLRSRLSVDGSCVYACTHVGVYMYNRTYISMAAGSQPPTYPVHSSHFYSCSLSQLGGSTSVHTAPVYTCKHARRARSVGDMYCLDCLCVCASYMCAHINDTSTHIIWLSSGRHEYLTSLQNTQPSARRTDQRVRMLSRPQLVSHTRHTTLHHASHQQCITHH
jgi:hypothetical protein